MSAEAEDPKDGFTLGEQVGANSSSEVVAEIPENATIERLSLRIYGGPEHDLNIVPTRRTSGQGGKRDYPLVRMFGQDHIDGEDDRFVWNISRAVEKGEKVVMKAENTDPNNPHHYRANLDVDYRGGLGGWLIGALRRLI